MKITKKQKRQVSHSLNSVEKNLISSLETLITQLSDEGLLIILEKAHFELNKVKNMA